MSDWYDLYSVPMNLINWSWTDFDKASVMGRTHYCEGPPRWAHIEISKVFAGHGIMLRAIRWHEYCHAEPWIKYGVTDGHSVGFLRRQLR